MSRSPFATAKAGALLLLVLLASTTPAGSGRAEGTVSLAASETPRSAAAVLPPGFVERTVASGLNKPTNFTFTPDGRIFVTEQPGVVRVIEDGALLAIPLIDIQDRVNDYWQRGLFSVATDPNFASNGFLYLLYTYENNPKDYTGPKTGRLTRVTVVGNQASPESEVVILGTAAGGPCSELTPGADCIPSDYSSHGIADVRFASDGTLFVTIGDAAPNALEPLSLRAQDIDSLAGKVLHINSDGTGVTGNPFWNGDPNGNRSKVWALGLRNPFRLTLRPDTGMVYVGDVGWHDWEEIDVVPLGANLGWPCYEGPERQVEYEPDALCQALYALGPSAVTPPLYSYPHERDEEHSPACAIGGDFAVTADTYFFADCMQSWIHYLTVDANDSLISVRDFAAVADRPVALKAGPEGGIYYLTYAENELRHICWPSCDTAAADFDGDGCTDLQEQGSNETLGGRRDPLNPWDFYDTNGDGEIDLFIDMLGVIQHYSLDESPPYDAAFDRGPTTGPNPWNMTAPDGSIDLFIDILGVIRQYGHDCT